MILEKLNSGLISLTFRSVDLSWTFKFLWVLWMLAQLFYRTQSRYRIKPELCIWASDSQHKYDDEHNRNKLANSNAINHTDNSNEYTHTHTNTHIHVRTQWRQADRETGKGIESETEKRNGHTAISMITAHSLYYRLIYEKKNTLKSNNHLISLLLLVNTRPDEAIM